MGAPGRFRGPGNAGASKSSFRVALDNLQRNLNTSKHLSYMLSFFEEAVGTAMKLVGPALIMLATGLITGVMYWGIRFIVPMYGAPVSAAWCLHSAIALFLGGNMLFNYAMCAAPTLGRPTRHSAANRGQACNGALPSNPEDAVGFRPRVCRARQCRRWRSCAGEWDGNDGLVRKQAATVTPTAELSSLLSPATPVLIFATKLTRDLLPSSLLPRSAVRDSESQRVGGWTAGPTSGCTATKPVPQKRRGRTLTT